MEAQYIHYTANPSAVQIHDAPHRIKAVCGPVGSGKSTVACWEFWLLCYESPIPLHGVVIRSSYRELHDSTRKTFDYWFAAISTYKEGDEEAHLTFAGRDGVSRTHTLAFRACKREAEAQKFMSTEYAFIWLEEVVPAFTSARAAGGVMGAGLPRGVYALAQMRLRQAGAHRVEILLTFNPPATTHWTYQEFFQTPGEALERKNIAFFRQPPGENATNLRASYYEELLENLSPDLARRFVFGEVTTTYEGERVFPECIENLHIVDKLDPVPGVPLTCGQDFGLSPCTAVTQILPGGQWLILGELQLVNRGIKAFIEYLGPYLQQNFPGYTVRKVWQDPAGGNQRSQIDETETCGALLRQAGYEVADGRNEWALRREVMKQRFEWAPGGKPGVLVSRQDCPIITEGLLGGYRYPTTAAGVTGTSPIKNAFSHLMDACQMIATGEFSLLSGLVSKDELAVRELIRRHFPSPFTPNPPAPRHSPTGWMRR